MRKLYFLLKISCLLMLAVNAHAVLLENMEFPKGARVGIFIGAFDPPHLGHDALMRTAMREANLDYVIIIPNGNAIHKMNAYSIDVRTNLVRSVYEDSPDIVVPAQTKFKKNNTMAIVDKIKQTRPDIHLTGIYGTDVLEDNLKNKAVKFFFKKRYDSIFVSTSREVGVTEFPEKVWDLPTVYGKSPLSTSSTKIRNFLLENPEFYLTEMSEEKLLALSDMLKIDPRVLQSIHNLDLFAGPEKPKACAWMFSWLGKTLEPKK